MMCAHVCAHTHTKTGTHKHTCIYEGQCRWAPHANKSRSRPERHRCVPERQQAEANENQEPARGALGRSPCPGVVRPAAAQERPSLRPESGTENHSFLGS